MGDWLSCRSRFGYAVLLGCGVVFLTTAAFGADAVFLKEKPEGNQGAVIEETDEYVLIRFPRSEIRLIRRDAWPNKEQEARSPERHLAPARETMLERQERLHTAPEAEKEAAARPGAVFGRILYRGQGLAGCKVKLIRQLESTTFLGLFKEATAGVEFDAVTGEDGLYRFERVPPGKYLLRWLPPGSDAWIQRLSEQQHDVVVAEGLTVGLRVIEMARPVLDR